MLTSTRVQFTCFISASQVCAERSLFGFVLYVTRARVLPVAEDFAFSLGEALSCGDKEEAVQLCQKLSELSVPVTVRVDCQAYPQEAIR